MLLTKCIAFNVADNFYFLKISIVSNSPIWFAPEKKRKSKESNSHC
jgi:hypothetical protein